MLCCNLSVWFMACFCSLQLQKHEMISTLVHVIWGDVNLCSRQFIFDLGIGWNLWFPLRWELFCTYRKQTEDRTKEQRLDQELGNSLKEKMTVPSASRNEPSSAQWQTLRQLEQQVTRCRNCEASDTGPWLAPLNDCYALWCQFC